MAPRGAAKNDLQAASNMHPKNDLQATTNMHPELEDFCWETSNCSELAALPDPPFLRSLPPISDPKFSFSWESAAQIRGLVSLHAHKPTVTSPQFVWATPPTDFS